jgi:hypothetical protein
MPPLVQPDHVFIDVGAPMTRAEIAVPDSLSLFKPCDGPDIPDGDDDQTMPNEEEY